MSRKTKETLQCACVLTDTEKLAYGLELAEKAAEAARKTANLAAYSKQIKGEIGTLQDQMANLSEKLNTGKEFRPVECLVRYDWENKVRKWIRTDTMEEEKNDIIPEEDLQEQMKLDQKKADKDHKHAEELIDEAQATESDLA
jgi:hypothetical protein